jgi:hypothetical protein
MRGINNEKDKNVHTQCQKADHLTLEGNHWMRNHCPLVQIPASVVLGTEYHYRPMLIQLYLIKEHYYVLLWKKTVIVKNTHPYHQIRHHTCIHETYLLGTVGLLIPLFNPKNFNLNYMEGVKRTVSNCKMGSATSHDMLNNHWNQTSAKSLNFVLYCFLCFFHMLICLNY